MFPRNENRNEGTFGCSPGTKTGTRVRSHVPPERKTGTRAHSPKPPFYETALLSPLEKRALNVSGTFRMMFRVLWKPLRFGIYNFSRHLFNKDAAFLLTVGGFLLTVELFYLQLTTN